MDDIALSVKDVSKQFKLPHERHSSLKNRLIHSLRGSKGFEAQKALSQISFEVKKGEFFGIVGRNGSGKSTLLKILAGIYQPTKGQVEVHGKLVPFIELGVGFNPELTGRENVFLNGALLGFSQSETEAQYNDIVEFAELGKFMDQKLKNYSSGMQVRLAFSMATRAQSDILLIDEVLAVGDADFQRKCFDYFKQLKKAGKTVVFVSHDMSAIREYCDQAILIEDSRILERGATGRVAEAYLQLFMREQQAGEKSAKDQPKRWGDGHVITERIAVSVQPEQITITETIKATQDIEHPIAGIRIRDAAGADVTGTNSRIEDCRLPKLAAGERLELSWRLPNVLRDGSYVVDPALHHADEVTVADWWDEAAEFKVKKTRHLPYLMDPGFTLKVTKPKALRD